MACDDCQDVINAALESVADLLDSGDDWNTGDEIAEFIRSRIGTNPLAERAAEYARGIEFRVGQLAERDARIAELERELSEQANAIVDGLAKRRKLERERDRATQHHERCAEKLFKAERELAEARKGLRNCLLLASKHAYRGDGWAEPVAWVNPVALEQVKEFDCVQILFYRRGHNHSPGDMGRIPLYAAPQVPDGMVLVSPEGEVIGPCVCGGWPGGKCLRCKVVSNEPSSPAR